MINLVDPIRRALRADPILKLVVGEDADGEYKVYTSVAKTDVTAPYIVVTVVPAIGPVGTYGEMEAWEPLGVSLASWAENPTDAWALADMADDALLRADYSFEPYDLIQVRRASTPMELPDRNSNLRQVIVQYEFIVGR